MDYRRLHFASGFMNRKTKLSKLITKAIRTCSKVAIIFFSWDILLIRGVYLIRNGLAIIILGYVGSVNIHMRTFSV
jgi:hypothetical protein